MFTRIKEYVPAFFNSHEILLPALKPPLAVRGHQTAGPQQ